MTSPRVSRSLDDAPPCTVPTCGDVAARCDVDHDDPRPGGPTCGCHRLPLCALHHRMKQARGWTVRDRPDGSRGWTTPAGLAVTAPLPRPGTPPPAADPLPRLTAADVGDLDLLRLRAAVAAAARPPRRPDTWDRGSAPPF